MKKSKSYLSKILSFLALVLLFYFIAELFFHALYLNIIASLISSIILYLLLKRVLAFFNLRIARKNFIIFLENFNNALDMNLGLSQAINFAIDKINNINKNRTLAQALRRVQTSIKLGAPFRSIFLELISAFPCPEAKGFFSLLEKPHLLGNNIKPLADNTLNLLLLSEKHRNQIIADRTQSFVETICITLMPLLIIIFLRAFAPDYIYPTYNTSSGVVLFFLAYLLLMISIVIATFVFVPKVKLEPKNKSRKKISKASKKKFKKSKSETKKDYYKLIKQSTPVLLLGSLNKKINILQIQGYNSQEQIYELLFKNRIKYFIYSLLIFTLGTVAGVPIFLSGIISILLLIYPDYSLRRKANSQIKEMQTLMPNLLNSIVTTLSVGYNLEGAIKFSADYADLGNSLNKELNLLLLKLKNSRPLEQALKEFIDKFDNQDLSNFFSLLNQYCYSGSMDSLRLIKLQLEQVQEKLFNRQRQEILAKSNNYLIPMVVNLMTVFIICLAPIFATLQF